MITEWQGENTKQKCLNLRENKIINQKAFMKLILTKLYSVYKLFFLNICQRKIDRK